MPHHLIQCECMPSWRHCPPSPLVRFGRWTVQLCGVDFAHRNYVPRTTSVISRLINNGGGGGWCVHFVEAWQTGICPSLQHNRNIQQLVAIRISINNPSFNIDRYTRPAPRWHVKITPPPTELQIPATILTLLIFTGCFFKLTNEDQQQPIYWCCWQ